MEAALRVVLVCLGSYLLGSVPFGYMAARACGHDITREGSGSIGATNVLRSLGPKYAIIVLLLDAAKGFVGAYLGKTFLDYGALGAIAAGALAVAGHNWSVFLRFKGGKGVAASAGVVLLLFPYIILAALLVFILSIAITRYVSLGSILGAWTAFFLSLLPGYTAVDRAMMLVLVTAIMIQHRSNIGRLLSGNERKITFRPTEDKGGEAR